MFSVKINEKLIFKQPWENFNQNEYNYSDFVLVRSSEDTRQ